MSSVSELKDRINNKTLNLVLLTIATAGLYPILWLWRNVSVINQVTKGNAGSDLFIIWIAVCAGMSGALAGSGEDALDIISGLFSIALAVLYIVWAFKARTALQQYALNELGTDLRMNGFYTFIFTLYYINYCINDLPEAKRKQDLLAGRATQAA
jgi:hypothetical protein